MGGGYLHGWATHHTCWTLGRLHIMSCESTPVRWSAESETSSIKLLLLLCDSALLLLLKTKYLADGVAHLWETCLLTFKVGTSDQESMRNPRGIPFSERGKLWSVSRAMLYSIFGGWRALSGQSPHPSHPRETHEMHQWDGHSHSLNICMALTCLGLEVGSKQNK
jgi:hypothetical protein